MPPPAPNPPTIANLQVQQAGNATANQAAAAAGMEYAGTIQSSPEGAGNTPIAPKTLLGS